MFYFVIILILVGVGFWIFLGTTDASGASHPDSDIDIDSTKVLFPHGNTVEVYGMLPYVSEEYDHADPSQEIMPSRTMEESVSIVKAHEEACPLLSPERYARRIKMFFGIDVNDYPPNTKILLGQTPSGLSGEIPPALIAIPSLRAMEALTFDILFIAEETEYAVMYNRWMFMGDTSVVPDIEERVERMRVGLPHLMDLRYGQYQAAIFDARDDLLEYVDNILYNNALLPKIDLIAGDFHRYSDIRLDALYLYILKQQAAGRTIWKALDQRGSGPDNEDYHKYIFMNETNEWILWQSHSAIEENIKKILANAETPWPGYIPEAGLAAYLNFMLRLDVDDVYSFISRHAGNDHLGYGLLRDFVEGNWKQSVLRAKQTESYLGNVKSNTKLWLEPHDYAFDIDDLHPTDTLTLIEMGYDDYYFVEVMLPVESPVRDENGYAKLAGRKEKVKGYVKRSDVVLGKKLSEGIGLPREENIDYQKNPYLLLHIAKYKDRDTAKSAVLSVEGPVNIDCDIALVTCDELQNGELFMFWEVEERPEQVIVQTEAGFRGFIDRQSIRQY